MKCWGCVAVHVVGGPDVLHGRVLAALLRPEERVLQHPARRGPGRRLRRRESHSQPCSGRCANSRHGSHRSSNLSRRGCEGCCSFCQAPQVAKRLRPWAGQYIHAHVLSSVLGELGAEGLHRPLLRRRPVMEGGPCPLFVSASASGSPARSSSPKRFPPPWRIRVKASSVASAGVRKPSSGIALSGVCCRGWGWARWTVRNRPSRSGS